MKRNDDVARVATEAKRLLRTDGERRARAYVSLAITGLRNVKRPIDEHALRIALGRDADRLL